MIFHTTNNLSLVQDITLAANENSLWRNNSIKTLTIITYFLQFPGSAIIFLCKPRENPYGLYAGIEFYKIVVVTKNRLASSFLSSTRLKWVTTKINAYTYADQGWSAQKSRRWLVNLQQASLWKWILHMLEISILSPLLQDFFFFFLTLFTRKSQICL